MSRVVALRAKIAAAARRIVCARRELRALRENQRRRRAALHRLLAEQVPPGRPTVMFDSTTPQEIPANAEAVLLYVDGLYANWRDGQRAFSHAYRFPITVLGGTEHATFCDVEAGDLPPSGAVEWLRLALNRGVHLPGPYHSVEGMDELLAMCARAGIPRERLRVITAHYSYGPHLCGPHSCGLLRSTTADATQWTDTALGRNLDQTLLGAGFWR